MAISAEEDDDFSLVVFLVQILLFLGFGVVGRIGYGFFVGVLPLSLFFVGRDFPRECDSSWGGGFGGGGGGREGGGGGGAVVWLIFPVWGILNRVVSGSISTNGLYLL